MANETNLREAKNVMEVEGVLHEKNLEVKTQDGVEMISGSISIKVDDKNIITFNVRQNKFTKEKKENSVYAGLVTVMNEYKSVAEVGEELADKVRVSRGQLNPYYNVNTKKDNLVYRTNFVSRVKDMNKFKPHAEVDVEVYISSITPEVYKSGENQGEETGRAVLKGWMPTYNGIEPVFFVVPVEYADTVLSEYKAGQTVEIFADVINNRVEETRIIPVKIGKPQKKTIVDYVNELVLTGISESYEDKIENGEPCEKPYDRETIQKAITEREINNTKRAEKSNSNSVSNSNPAPVNRPVPNF